ncbi:MAG: hypothetical protein VB138_11565 [Burkholderia sp.]
MAASMISISLPLETYVATVIRVQFRWEHDGGFACIPSSDMTKDDQAVSERFLAGISQSRLEIQGPSTSIVIGQLLSFMSDFVKIKDFELFRRDVDRFGTPEEASIWYSLSSIARDAVHAEAGKVGRAAQNGWEKYIQITRAD